MKFGWKDDRFVIGGESILMDNFLHDHHMRNNIQDYPAKGIDGYPLDYPPDAEILARSKQLGLFNGYRLAGNPTDDNLRACEPRRYFFIMDLLRATNDFKRPETQRRFKKYEDFLEDYYDGIFKVILKYPDNAWGCAVGEIDNACPWPKEGFRSRKEAFAFWKDTFFNCRVGSGDSAGIFSYLKKRRIDYRKANIMVHGALLFGLHHFFDWGFRFVWLERGCGLSNVQIGVAFLRGAARQYRGKWGLDYSTHHPHRNQCTWYDAQGRRRGGWTESLMLRSWMVGFLSGADVVHEETSNYTHWIVNKKGGARLSPAGEHAKRFADFALHEHPERGLLHAPVALMLNYYHGFDARHSIQLRQPMVWGGTLRYKDSDANISNLLELFFPGHNQSWGMFDEAFNPNVPWKSQGEYLEMLKKGHDMRPYEAGHLVNSPFGDCLDVIVDTAGLETLQRYPLIFLGGEQELDGNKGRNLLVYLKKGGTVVSSFEQLPDEIRQEVKLKKLPSTASDWDYDLNVCRCCGKRFGGARYSFHRLTAPKAKVLGVNHLGVPLAWEIPYAKGKVILTAVSYSQDIPASRLLPLYAHLFGKYIDPVILAKADPPTLQLIVNRGKDFLLIGAFNNFSKPWKGVIRINDMQGASSAEDIWNKSKTVLKNGNIISTIKPYDFAVYKIYFSL